MSLCPWLRSTRTRFTHLQAEWEKLSAQTVAELKELCALHGLRKTGVKAELVARLLVSLCT